MDPRLLLRIVQVARRRPSRRQVLIGLVAIAAALLLSGIEATVGWPEALTPVRLLR